MGNVPNDDMSRYVKACESFQELLDETRRQLDPFLGTVFGCNNELLVKDTLVASLEHLGKYMEPALLTIRELQEGYGVKVIGSSVSGDMAPERARSDGCTSVRERIPVQEE